MDFGYMMFLLHAHLPYVRHPDQKDSLEERWFFESCTECYIPLLNSFECLALEGVKYRLAVSLSPSLLSMMTDDLLKEKYLSYLENMIRLGQTECDRTARNPEFHALAEGYLRQLEYTRGFFNGCGGDLTARFKSLAGKGCLELLTTSATHGFLPLIHTRESRKAQVEVGLNLFHRLFGYMPQGFWLPECSYENGLDSLLKEAGIKYFIVDTHGVLTARPEPVYGIFAPVHCRTGVAVFGRDPESSRQVWERREGYPGHPEYREFYRDIAYDMDFDYIKPYLPGGITRVDTGYKYYRITGRGKEKEVYRPEAARRVVQKHALDFMTSRIAQFKKAGERMDRTPMVLSPYDAELFGHWWHEGPAWLEHVLRLAGSTGGVKTVTPADYLKMYPENQLVDLPKSSWGEGGHNYVWLNPKNDWIYRHQHVAETKMTEIADRHRQAGGVVRRALNQAGRELLLAQSSDWAFIIKEETTVQYAQKRIIDHLSNFMALLGQLESGTVDENLLSDLEARDNIFPGIDFSVFCSRRQYRPLFKPGGMRVIMLSWEYPPRTVGGLGRHVYDLSGALSRLGAEIHVFTCPARHKPLYEVDDRGVRVYRVSPDDLGNGDFLEWLRRLNAGMIKKAGEAGLADGYFHLVHAHDWLVRDAAREIAEKGGLPLVVTIHATEYGRNRGIFSELQRQIHNIEGDLVASANQVICCSNYMAREVSRLFGREQSEIEVIPNGVDAGTLVLNSETEAGISRRDCSVIAFLGRLVPEKGVQVLIEALPMIREKHPEAVLVVAGRGPYEKELKKLAARLGVTDNVNFIGFVDDAGRNRLLAKASVAVFPSTYEPFGIVALEAMAAGTPVVVSETGGLSEIIDHGLDGLKAPPGRADMLARYVLEMLDHPALAEKFGQKAYNKVLSQFDWNRIAHMTAQVYERAKGQKPEARSQTNMPQTNVAPQ